MTTWCGSPTWKGWVSPVGAAVVDDRGDHAGDGEEGEAARPATGEAGDDDAEAEHAETRGDRDGGWGCPATRGGAICCDEDAH